MTMISPCSSRRAAEGAAGSWLHGLVWSQCSPDSDPESARNSRFRIQNCWTDIKKHLQMFGLSKLSDERRPQLLAKPLIAPYVLHRAGFFAQTSSAAGSGRTPSDAGA